MRTIAAFFLTLFSSILWVTPVNAVPVLSPVGGYDANNPGGLYTYGWEFDVLSEITVDKLGVYDAGQDGLAESHQVGLWNSAGTLLASATIGAGTGAALDGIFRMEDVTDTLLTVGTGYIIGATNWDVDKLLNGATSLISDPSINYVTSRFLNTGGALQRPTSSIGGLRYWGPSFSTVSTPVPEPGSLALFGLGLAGLGFVRRKKA